MIVTRVETKDFSREEWTVLISGFRDLSLPQTWDYGAVLDGWQVERTVILAEKGEPPLGAVQAMIRPRARRGRRGGAGCPRSPVAAGGGHRSPDIGLSDGRVTPALAGASFVHPPPPPLELEGIYPVRGFVPVRPGWASVLVDLTIPPEALRNRLRPRWRVLLEEAEGSELEGVVCADETAFESFLVRFPRTHTFAAGLTPVAVRRLQAALSPEQRLLVCEVRRAGRSLGGALMGFYGNTAEYLGSTPDHPSV